jgi:biotin synthase
MQLRHDWTKAEVRALHDLPLLELTYRAQTVHRETFGDNAVQLCSLLSVKTAAARKTAPTARRRRGTTPA